MNKRCVFLIAVAATFIAPAAIAQGRFTAKELQSACQKSEEPRSTGCMAYLAGVHHTLQVLKRRVTTCVPGDLNHASIRQIFLDWTEKNSSELDQLAVVGVIKSLLAKYPCAGKQEEL